MTHDPQTGSSNAITYKWLVGVLVTAVLAGIGGWAAMTSGRIADIETEHKNSQAETAGLKQGFTDILRRLERIESKLDSLSVDNLSSSYEPDKEPRWGAEAAPVR